MHRPAALALILLAACSPPPPQATPHVAAPVRAQTVAVEEFRDALVVPATLEARQRALLAPEVMGRIDRVSVRIGDPVRAGQELLRIDPTLYSQGLQQAEAALRLAQVQQEQARSVFARLDTLRESAAVSAMDHDKARIGVELADAQVAQAQVGRDVAAARVDQCSLRAPFAGIVTARNVQPGEMFGGKDPRPPLELVDLSSLRVVASVSELDVADLHPGQQVEVRVRALGPPALPATLDRINAAVDPLSRTVMVEALIDNTGGLLKHGMAAELVISGTPRSLPAVPRAALVDRSEGSARVFVVDEEGRAALREVRYSSSSGDRVAVTDGLHGGERVLVAGHTRLADGARIEILTGAP